MLYRFARSFIFQLNPEKAHDLTMKGFTHFTGTPLDLFYRQKIKDNPVEVMGLKFKNPVGLAAGLDKNGECIAAFGAMGFGFVEVGTVTPLAQPGNDKPRIFRLVDANGIINRMGFNNLGVDNLVENLKKTKYKGIIGVNIGKNKTTPIENGKDDYIICMEKVYLYSDYICINISSPNTPNLRTLQYGEALDELLISLKEKQEQLTKEHNKYVPLVLKIAPDLTDDEISQICKSLLKYKFDGITATNTTIGREKVDGFDFCNEEGGLSGEPLNARSTEVIQLVHNELQGNIPIIGVGGISSYITAKEKFMAGASLVQLYTGFIYEGPKLVKTIVENIKL